MENASAPCYVCPPIGGTVVAWSLPSFKLASDQSTRHLIWPAAHYTQLNRKHKCLSIIWAC